MNRNNGSPSEDVQNVLALAEGLLMTPGAPNPTPTANPATNTQLFTGPPGPTTAQGSSSGTATPSASSGPTSGQDSEQSNKSDTGKW